MQDPRALRAVAVGSVSLLNALHRREQSGLSPKDDQKLMAKLLRYRIRMSTRPTPYGLFAGCAFVPVRKQTDVSVINTFGCSRTRPDMVWLMNFVAGAEADPAVRSKLRFTTNSLIYEEAGRVSLTARLPGGRGEKSQPVSIRATSVVSKALELAKTGIGYAELAGGLLALRSPSATPEKVDRLIAELIEQTFLITDLRPPLTTESPAQYVMDRLGEDAKLKAFLQAACRWDRASHQESIAGFPALLRAVDCPEDGSKELPCQVDMALALNGNVGSIIADEAARAAELLLRFSLFPGGLSSIAAYRKAFVSRYGNDREVPLPELLDSARGLGPVFSHGHAQTGPGQNQAAVRARTLLTLACSALNARQRVVNLSADVVANLATSQLTPEAVPVSLDINLMIAAKSGAAIDRGEFIAVVGPNLGAWAACRNFGRFAHLYRYESGTALLRRAALQEQNHFPHDLWAEVVYLPANVRSANVTVRPAIRSHEIVFGVSPGVPAENVLALDDLMAGVDNGRFYVRSRRHGKRIRFVSGHMLNSHTAPAAAQFLLEVAHDGAVTFNSFDWGPAETFPYLPRVQVGRIVLRPAEWKVFKDQNLAEWRESWSVPRYVCLTFGDNRLVIDLDCEDHRAQVLSEQKKLAEGQSLLLQEVLPALDDLWLQGAEGHYYSELIVPLVRRPLETAAQPPVQPPAQSPIAVPASERLRPPGSDWLFAKLYCPARCEDELIAERLLPFAKNAEASGLAASWFFIRYADPEPHIRLRFHGQPERLSSHLFGQVSQWARQLMDDGICSRVAFDTYDREIERYGGLQGIKAAEQVFHADSEASATLVKVLRTKQWEDADQRTALLAISLDDLLRAGGLQEDARLEWYKTYATDHGKEGGNEYRRLKGLLRHAIGGRANWLAGVPSGDAIDAAMVRRAECLPKIQEDAGKLCQSFLHLHLNRVGAASAERMILGLLFRVRASLINAPFELGSVR